METKKLKYGFSVTLWGYKRRAVDEKLQALEEKNRKLQSEIEKKEDEIQHLQLENEKFLMQLKIKQRILDEFKSNDIIEKCAKISVE